MWFRWKRGQEVIGIISSTLRIALQFLINNISVCMSAEIKLLTNSGCCFQDYLVKEEKC